MLTFFKKRWCMLVFVLLLMTLLCGCEPKISEPIYDDRLPSSDPVGVLAVVNFSNP